MIASRYETLQYAGLKIMRESLKHSVPKVDVLGIVSTLKKLLPHRADGLGIVSN